MKVSWQVTGIRQDAWANAHRIPVEEDKPLKEQGMYLHPELYGASEEQSLMKARHPDLFKGQNLMKAQHPERRKSMPKR